MGTQDDMKPFDYLLMGAIVFCFALAVYFYIKSH